MAKYKKTYNTDSNKFESTKSGSNPASNTRKRMKREAAATAASKKTSTPSKPKASKPAKTAPTPRPRSERKTRPAGMPGRTSAPSRASKGGFRGSGYVKVPGIGFAQYRDRPAKRKMGGSF